MRTLQQSEYRAIFSNLEDMLSMNGDYAMVNSKTMEAVSMSIYTVKNGKLYDDISWDICKEAYDADAIAETKELIAEGGYKFALLTKQYPNEYPA